jgi:hypothetical protein
MQEKYHQLLILLDLKEVYLF